MADQGRRKTREQIRHDRAAASRSAPVDRHGDKGIERSFADFTRRLDANRTIA
jgi:hypothetical protein